MFFGKSCKIMKLNLISSYPKILMNHRQLCLSITHNVLSRHLSCHRINQFQERGAGVNSPFCQKQFLNPIVLLKSNKGQKCIIIRYCSSDKPKSILAEKYTRYVVDDAPKVEEKPKKAETISLPYFGKVNKEKLKTIGLICAVIYMAILGALVVNIYGAPELDKDGKEIIDEFSEMDRITGYLYRFKKVAMAKKKEIAEPSFEKLLPDPVKEPLYQPPYTLVLEVSDVLVHPEWTFNQGWRYKKRPHVDEFLNQIGYPRYEVVVYTKEMGQTMFPAIDQLDKQQKILYRLFRDATRYEDGAHKKDIRNLNRDPSKVIIVDCEPEGVSLSPRNAILLDKWEGNEEDSSLLDLASFLSALLAMGPDDVRVVLDNYHDSGSDVLSTFRERQLALREQQEQAKQAQQPTLLSKYSKGFRR